MKQGMKNDSMVHRQRNCVARKGTLCMKQLAKSFVKNWHLWDWRSL